MQGVERGEAELCCAYVNADTVEPEQKVPW
jgi:hypothetical protein